MQRLNVKAKKYGGKVKKKKEKNISRLPKLCVSVGTKLE